MFSVYNYYIYHIFYNVFWLSRVVSVRVIEKRCTFIPRLARYTEPHRIEIYFTIHAHVKLVRARARKVVLSHVQDKWANGVLRGTCARTTLCAHVQWNISTGMSSVRLRIQLRLGSQHLISWPSLLSSPISQHSVSGLK